MEKRGIGVSNAHQNVKIVLTLRAIVFNVKERIEIRMPLLVHA